MLCLRLSLNSVRSVIVWQKTSFYRIVAQNNVDCGSRNRSTLNGKNVLPSKFPDMCPPIRGFKSDLKIKWVRPVKIPCINPEKSGDMKPAPQVDVKGFPLSFEMSRELVTASDLVKRVFSLEFMPRSKAMKVLHANMVNNVKMHALDGQSLEAKIASMTSGIRNMQAAMEHQRKNRKMTVCLKELIDRRKKFLKYLRRSDYKRFEWLLEKLDLVYHPPPDHFHWVTRKDSLRKLTDKYCEDLKQERLASYKERLESQQVAFLQEKATKLKWIIEEEKACGVETSVSQNEVDEVLQKLNELEIRRGIKRGS